MQIPSEAKRQIIKGTTYIFLDKPVWNPEKKRGEHKRQYIGKMDGDTFIPNGKYLLSMQEKAATKRGPAPVSQCKRSFYGATYLLDRIGEKLGITADLKSCFPDTYRQILSLCYYLVAESGLPLYRFPKWASTHSHPYGKDIPSQRISELLGTVTESAKMEFFRRQAARRAEEEYLAFDTTSISSYSELIKLAKYGKNKEGDLLPQINLALLYGQTSRLPAYYRKLPGNTADVKLLRNLLEETGFLGMERLNFVLDRGFYSEDNINDMMKHHHKFLVGVKNNLNLVKKHLDAVRGEIMTSWEHYRDDLGLYVMNFSDRWDYREEQPRSGKTVTGKRRIYIHLCFNDQRCTDERTSFARYLSRLEEELRSGKRNPAHEREYSKYFEWHQTPKRGMVIQSKEDAIREKQRNFGYFALLSNSIKDPVEAVTVYRTRDVIEKAFEDLKSRLSMRRMSVSSAENFEGKLFIQFVALMYLSYIKRRMEEKELFKGYTMQTLLDSLDIIERWQQPGMAPRLSEVTEKQQAIYAAMEVEGIS